MPTFERTEQFDRDYDALSPEERKQFMTAVDKFIEDLSSEPRSQFRRSLRVKSMQSADGIFEMSWGQPDGRATFQYGEEIHAGEPHVIWRRVGSHRIFANP